MTTATGGPDTTSVPSVAPPGRHGSDDVVVDVPDATRLSPAWMLAGIVAVAAAAAVGLSVGPVTVPVHRTALELVDRLPLLDVDSGLTATERAIVWDIRTPRVVLGLLVGAMLAGSGAAYQGVFRNPLADPYLLGIAAGAGLGATLAIVTGVGDGIGMLDPIPLFAFVGALVAVAAAAMLSLRRNTPSTPATLILAGVAVAAFFTAVQTYVQQRHAETLRQVYSWILGRLSTSGWDEVLLLLPYAAVCGAVMVASVGALDVLAVGDEEARSLGVHPRRIRGVVLVAASLATAAAVAVSGLIGFVGLIVPHGVRLVAGVTHRRVIPLSLLFGAAFLALADVLARTVQSPAELPIGVVTVFIGAPFFLAILRSRERDVIPAIEWDDVTVELGGHTILDGVTLAVARGSWLSLVGPNGAGKTTLVRSLGGSVGHRGRITIDGQELGPARIRDRARRLAMVPQHPVIPPAMPVFDYVLLGRAPHQGLRYSPSVHDRRRTFAVLQRIGLDDFTDRRVDTLSGGERQRVVLARALVQDTPVLVLDEPTAALDVGHQLEVLELIADLRTERDLTVVTTVHDLTVAGQFADSVAVLARGRLVGEGSPADVLTPAVIGEHWGVDATCEIDDRGAVTVTIRRRREPATPRPMTEAEEAR